MYNELYHHGIKGMRWGVRHDKPSSGHRKRLSRAERRAARQRELRAAQQNRAKRAAAQTREQRAQQFNQNVKDNWYKPYNKANETFNKNLESVNSRYGKLDVNDAGEYTTLEGYNYVKEIDNLWQTTYSQALLSEFGEHPTFGKKWVEEAPFMDSFIPEYWVEKSVIDAAKAPKNRSDQINDFLRSYKPAKDSPNTLFDFDDPELIDLNIDDPNFRKEYGVTDEEYKRYKKQLG